MNTDKLRELLAKATSGPWFYESLTAGHAITSGETVVAFCGPKNPDDSGYARNADLIAAMHESLPGLLSEINRLTGELDRLRKDAERYRIFCEQAESDQFPIALLNDVLEMGAGVLDMHFDDAIAAQEVE